MRSPFPSAASCPASASASSAKNRLSRSAAHRTSFKCAKPSRRSRMPSSFVGQSPRLAASSSPPAALGRQNASRRIRSSSTLANWAHWASLSFTRLDARLGSGMRRLSSANRAKSSKLISPSPS
eukprot:scaffold5766_cov256-Pinguiococcus_pyrenoidosus.AAC.3